MYVNMENIKSIDLLLQEREPIRVYMKIKGPIPLKLR